MACLEHECLTCRRVWFDNSHASHCPDCGSSDVYTTYDEPEVDLDDFDYNIRDEEDWL